SSASCSPATGSTASDCRSGASAATRSVDREPHLDGHLPVRDLPALDVPAGLQHLEPADVAHALRGLLDRDPDGVVTARPGRAGQFQGLVDVVAHGAPPSTRNLSVAPPTLYVNQIVNTPVQVRYQYRHSLPFWRRSLSFEPRNSASLLTP